MQLFDPRHVAEDDLRPLAELAATAATVDGWHPSLAPPPGRRILDWRHAPASTHSRIWVAGDEAGFAELTWTDRADNRDHVAVSIVVHPDARRTGVGTRLLSTAVRDAVETFDCRLVDVEAPTDGAAAAFLRRFGLEPRLVDRRNVCPLTALDPRLLESWAAVEQPELSLVEWDGPCPPEWVPAFCELQAVMDTAPLDDLEYEPEEHGVRRLEEETQAWLDQGNRWWTVCALHEPTGMLVGFTLLWFPAQWPGHVEQEDTGVLPAFRNRGIGRWIKARSALRLLAEYRERRERREHREQASIATWNAASNGPMNSLNEAMGFECVATWAEWQADAQQILAALG